MSNHNKQILLAWAIGLLGAFWDGVGSVGGLAILDQAVGLQVQPEGQKLKAALVQMLVVGFISMRRKLQESPLPQFKFEAEEPPKE